MFQSDRAYDASLLQELDEFLPFFKQHISALDIESAWELLKSKHSLLIKSLVSSRVIIFKHQADKPWIRRNIRGLINKQHRLYRRYCKSHNPDLFSKMKELGKNIAKEMREAESAYLDAVGEKLKANPKEVWKYVRTKRTVKNPIPDIIDGNNYAGDLEEKAEKFNNCFESLFVQSIPRPVA